MNKLKLPVALLLLLSLGSCQKNETSVDSAVTNAEAAEMVSSSLAVNSNGFVASASADIAVTAQGMYTNNPVCGSVKSVSINRTNLPGSSTTFTYDLNYVYTLNCNSSNVPDNITGTSASTGKFEGATLSATSAGTSNFRIAGLTPAATNYVLNAEHKMAGTFQSKIGEKHFTSTNVVLNITNLIMGKTSKLVTGGTATVSASGSTTKANFNFTGNIVFNSNNTALLTFGTVSFTIDLATGVVTKV